jgi:hypothetical protein
VDALVLALAALLQAPSPSPSPSPRPIRETAEMVIDRLEAERKDPCIKAARENVPCFPVKTEERGFDASVRQGLGLPDDKPLKPTPGGAPTVGETRDYRPHPGESAASVTIDPVCVGKSALKRLRGRNDTFYLYRIRDVHGERVALFDHKLDAKTVQGDVAFLGKFEGDCAAQAAYRREQRRTPPPPSPAP